MRRLMLGSMIVFAVLRSVSAEAQDVAFVIYGIGTKQCGEYLSDRQKSQNSYDSVAAAQYSDWAHGYVSGYNSTNRPRTQISATLPRATVIAYIDKYCRDKPLNAVGAAVDCLIANYGGPNYPHCK